MGLGSWKLGIVTGLWNLELEFGNWESEIENWNLELYLELENWIIKKLSDNGKKIKRELQKRHLPDLRLFFYR